MKINNLIKACGFLINFNFYGLLIRVCVQSQKDVELLEFQYGTFKVNNSFVEPEIEFYFLTDKENLSFFDSLFKKNKDCKKMIFFLKDGILNEYDIFTDWSYKPTPIPPFIFEPLCSRYIYLQGSAVCFDKYAISFLGEPFSGKSTLVNLALREINECLYLADDVQ
jgi:hypothetical protein